MIDIEADDSDLTLVFKKLASGWEDRESQEGR